MKRSVLRRIALGVLWVGVQLGCGPEQAQLGVVSDSWVAPQAVIGPLFSVSEGSLPISWAVNVAIDGAVLPDGRLALANFNERIILVFDSVGNVLHSIGGIGDGPGEFRGGVGTVIAVEDEIGAYDARAARFSVFDQEGDFTNSFSVPGEGVFRAVGWLRGYGLAVRRSSPTFGEQIHYTVLDSSGVNVSEFDGLPAPEPVRVGSRVADEECVAGVLEATIGSVLYVAESGSGTIRPSS